MIYCKENLQETSNLNTPHDVPAQPFIEKLAKYLKENVDQVQPPAWAAVAKTGSHVRNNPKTPTGGIFETPQSCEKSTLTDQ